MRAELVAMTIHGWESSVEFVCVNGVVQIVNGLPWKEWYDHELAYQADVERFLK